MTDLFDEPEGGTPIHPDERIGLRHRHITTKAELNELEAANIDSGLDWLEARGRRFDPLDMAQARQLHGRLFGGVWSWAGEFRRTEKNIGVNVWMISTETKILLDDVRFWIENQTDAPLEAAIRFHHLLVKIHPFANGNGRWARIMADTLLEKYFDHPPIDWAMGYESIESERRSEYTAALRAADNHDFEPLLEFAGIKQDKTTPQNHTKGTDET